MDDAVAAELRRIFETIFERPMPKLKLDTRPSQIDGWHSLRHAQLVMTIEEHFGIEFPEDKYSDFDTFGDLVDLVVAALRDASP